MPSDTFVRLKVFDVQGRPVRSIVNAQTAAGNHRAVWDGLDDRERPAASGVYLIRLETDRVTKTRMMTLVR